jgi:hypothetical protein
VCNGDASPGRWPWHDCGVPVAIFLAAAVILGGIIVVAMGKGGELSRERPELPARTDFRSWSDVADYRPPTALIGYHAAATERALALIARTIAERDAEIDWLRRRLAELQPERSAAAPAAVATPTAAVATAAVAPPAPSASTADATPTAAATAAAAPAVAEPAVSPAVPPVLAPAATPGVAPRAAPAEPELPVAEVSWQAGGTAGSGVANGFSAHQSVSRGFGEDE